MRKMRRAFILLGLLLLVGGLHSCSVRDWEKTYHGGFTCRDFVVVGQTGLGYWQFEVRSRKLARSDPNFPRRFDLPFLHVRIYRGPAWRLYALGDWFSLAGMILIPAMIFEVRARRRRRPGSGFPIEPKKNHAHTDGVNTSRAS